VSAATENYTKFQLATSLERKQEAIKATGSNRMSSISSLFSSIREKLIGKGTIIDPLPSNEYLSVHCQDPVEEAHQQSHDAPLVYSSARVVEQAPVRAQVVPYTGHLSQNTGQVTYHTVQPGESLSSISRQYYGNSSDWKILAQENGIQNSSSISVGTRLYIPHDPKNPSKDKLETLPITANAPVHYLNRYTAPSEQPLDYNNYEWKVYQAKSGDTLDSLAERFLGDGSKSSVLAQYNKLPVNTALPANYTLLVPQEKRTAITERYILSTQGVFR
jgi:nucleoid-associated protein YgaU